MWTFRGKEVYTHEHLLPYCTDFVYIISYTNGQQYVGKKNVQSIRKRPPLKGKKRNRLLMIKHPFLNYEGSHDSASELTVSKKEILYQCSTKKAATYLEAAYLFHFDCIFDPHYLNSNISGTFYDSDLKGLLEA